MKIIAIVGMPGSGKSEALKTIEELGIPSFNMGDVVTKIEPAKRGIKKIDEYIENEIRTNIRKKLGPAAVAVVTSGEVVKMKADVVAIAGLHSFAELNYFRERFGDKFALLAIESSPDTRFSRVQHRKIRPLDKEAFMHRENEYAKNFDIPKIMEQADYKIINDSSIELFRQAIKRVVEKIIE